MAKHRRRPEKRRTCCGRWSVLQQVLVQVAALVVADMIRDLLGGLSLL